MPALQVPRQAEALQRWIAGPVGRAFLLEAQSAWMERGAEGAGGQVWLRLLPALDWPVPEPGARFSDVWTLAPRRGRWGGDWCADLHALPLATASVSRLDLRFVLESVPEPSWLLAECARVLRPDGRLLVFGVNPWSAVRLRWAKHGVRALARARIVHGLRSEGLEVLGQRTLGPRWRPAGGELSPRPARLEVGRVAWAVLAARRDAGLTPLRRPHALWGSAPGVPAA